MFRIMAIAAGFPLVIQDSRRIVYNDWPIEDVLGGARNEASRPVRVTLARCTGEAGWAGCGNARVVAAGAAEGKETWLDQTDITGSGLSDAGRKSRDFFDGWAPRYDSSAEQRFFFGPAHVAVLKAARAAGVAPGDVLDVGCGTGRLLERVALLWPHAHLAGIDAAPLMIAEARRKHDGDGRFDFQVGDAVALPFGPSSVDVAFSTFSHHHWSDQRAAVEAVARTLRPGGVFILANMEIRFAAGVQRKLFENAGLEVIAQRRPVRLAAAVLMTVGRKIS